MNLLSLISPNRSILCIQNESSIIIVHNFRWWRYQFELMWQRQQNGRQIHCDIDVEFSHEQLSVSFNYLNGWLFNWHDQKPIIMLTAHFIVSSGTWIIALNRSFFFFFWIAKYDYFKLNSIFQSIQKKTFEIQIIF